jgi:hypothetical protein
MSKFNKFIKMFGILMKGSKPRGIAGFVFFTSTGKITELKKE